MVCAATAAQQRALDCNRRSRQCHRPQQHRVTQVSHLPSYGRHAVRLRSAACHCTHLKIRLLYIQCTWPPGSHTPLSVSLPWHSATVAAKSACLGLATRFQGLATAFSTALHVRCRMLTALRTPGRISVQNMLLGKHQ